MSTEFKLPPLGDGVSEGVIVKVLVKEGETVAEDQSVLEIETNKAVAEVPSSVSGVIEEVHVREGDEVGPGAVVFTVKADDGAAADEPEASGDETEAAGDVEDAADEVETAEVKVEETKAEAEATERSGDGEVREPEKAESESLRAALTRTDAQSTDETRESRSHIPAAPSTRRFAREIGVDIGAVQGSGPGGRISIDDVKAYAKSLNSRAQTAPSPGTVGVPLPDFAHWGEVERVPLRGIRKQTADHLSTAWTSIPHVTHFDKADVTELEETRKRFGPRVEKAGGKLTPTAIILKVVAGALRRFPQFNSSIDIQRGELIMKKYCHIGVAVDTEHGLMVPVIRDVDEKSVTEISVELTEVAEKTRERKLTLEEMQGGCFTVSNLGGIGGTGFTPIVNAPEVAILGVARSQTEPVFMDDAFVPRTVMPLSLSYDHRVIDGADAARFLRWVAEALENPFLLSLEG